MLMRLASLAPGKRRFRDLSEQGVLALAISSEEEDGRIYAAYAAKLRAQYSRLGCNLRWHGDGGG